MTERRYKVLAIASHPVQYMSQIFRRLAERQNIELRVAYCSLRGAELARDPEFDTHIQWDIPLLDGYDWMPVRNLRMPRIMGICNPGIWTIIRKGRFDAILCFTGYRHVTFWLSFLAARLSRTAFLFGTDSTTLEPRDGASWKVHLKKFFWPRLFSLADQIIVPSSASRDLMRSLGLPQRSITVTPYSVDNVWWTERAKVANRSAVRAAWGASDGDMVVLFCAKLQSWKRPLDLLHAFAQLPKSTVLVYVGEGPMRKQLGSEAELLGVRERVHFLGFKNQSELPEIYASADLMVLPSEYEPFAVVVNEAMCCGCPVLCSDRVGAARDLVEPVCPDLIFPCGDIEKLASILQGLIANPSKLRELGLAFHTRILEWSPEKNIEATIEAVRTAISRLG
jgi:glycosyltransferase involved in cell wall biosynthesis